MITEVLICIADVTIGNGAGKWAFTVNNTYTLKQLQGMFLSRKQIAMFFKKRTFRGASHA